MEDTAYNIMVCLPMARQHNAINYDQQITVAGFTQPLASRSHVLSYPALWFYRVFGFCQRLMKSDLLPAQLLWMWSENPRYIPDL